MVGSFLQLKTISAYITHNPVDLLFGEELNLCTSESDICSLIIGMLLVGCKLLLGAVSHELHLVDETQEIFSQIETSTVSKKRLSFMYNELNSKRKIINLHCGYIKARVQSYLVLQRILI